MNPIQIDGANRRMSAPKEWDPTKDGPCETLAILDTGTMMQSAWKPEPDELAALNSGGTVVLSIWGRAHPVVSLGVAPDKVVPIETFSRAWEVLRVLTFMARTSGCTAGRDEALVKACEAAENVLGMPVPPDAKRDPADEVKTILLS